MAFLGVTAVLLVTACICLADPTRPKISDTFYAVVEYETHAGMNKTDIGRGYIAWDMESGNGVDSYQYNDEQGRLKFNATLLVLYSKGIEYAYRELANSTVPSCTKQSLTGTLPPFWGFVDDATYVGNKTVRHVVLNEWRYSVAGYRFELAVRSDDTTVPVTLNTQRAGGYEARQFISFDAGKPDSSLFTVPSKCE